MPRIVRFILTLFIISSPALGAGSATQGAFPDLPWGATGAVFGAGSIAWIQDPSAVHWNPALLPHVTQRSFMAGSGDLFGEGLVRHSFAAIALPFYKNYVDADAGGRLTAGGGSEISRVLGFGADILSLDAEGDTYRETRLTVGTAFSSLKSSTVGCNLSYLSVGGDVTGLSASGYDLDLGLTWHLTDRAQAGFVMRHALSNLSWDGGDSERLNLRLEGGVLLEWNHLFRFPAGLIWDPEGVGLQELSFGVDYRPALPMQMVGIQAGVRHRPGDDGGTLFSGGLTLTRGRVHAAYGLVAEEAGLGSTHRFHFGILF
ncbi:MAG: hypothetical protein KJ970_00645 [Candidatus Eisenbacteria bacterium]|uniref:PorV/PorQ family protein n=1 Tax=Eiseniibacteriota bacterium TaxID=2212470 RepID=A0A948WAW0_UNCEI|nr:hypothetical protein [Candidatus Eisenbacteria bacterium]MBU1949767.1 hypothetical protein [Candidatus Eisenbacteria bacterium]MBU2689408.1 hypothetical protein [Candidatus Eisenbacteria bacterium]